MEAIQTPIGAPNEADRFSDAPFTVALRELMEERGCSYRKLAYLTSLSAGYLNHVTHGSRPVPVDDVIERIAMRLRVAPSYFFEYRYRRVLRSLLRNAQIVDVLFAGLPAD
jgi:transcriptional regulator with XRE-family HTH domain